MEQAAFRSFYQKTAPVLRAYIARSTGSIDAADDILQDTCMRFLLKAPSTLTEAEMRGYLYRTAESLIVDRWRRHKREEARDLASAQPSDAPVSSEVADDVGSAFRTLKPQQRALLWMAYVEEFDHRRIALTAGVREKSVRVLLSRARTAFRAALKRFRLQPETGNGE
jgi:RNA polymerase sigma-70 factor (ECF subfamily)